MLFLCTGNSARSQMAEALARARSGGLVEAHSAGSHPKALHPNAVRVMRDEHGIDLAGHRSKHLSVFAEQRFDRVISLCDRVREVCPEFPGRPRDHPLEHPRPRRRARRRRRRRELPGLPADGRRARDPHRVPARRPRRPEKPVLTTSPGGAMTEPDEMVNVRYMVDDVDAAIEFYTEHLGFEVRTQRRPRLRRRHPRQPAAAAQRAGQLGRAAHARRRHARPRRLEPHPPHRRRHRRRGRPAPRRRSDASATTSSPAPAARRSCSRTPRATSSSCSNPPAADRNPTRGSKPGRTQPPRARSTDPDRRAIPTVVAGGE